MPLNDKDKKSLWEGSNLMAGDCNGCAVCLLSCPVWRQTHDQTLTFCGRMRSMQGGAGLKEIHDSVNKCVLCGSCEPVCSYGVESVMRTLEMRAVLSGESQSPGSEEGPSQSASGRVLLANPLLLADRKMLERALAHFDGVALYDDNGDDLSEALETGRQLDSMRLKRFISSLKGASEVMTTDGLLYRLINKLSPETKVVSLGEALLRVDAIKKSIGPDDMYVIDASTYNADYKRLVAFYDKIRRETGAMMNLDLHRVATPTGTSLHLSSGVVDPVSQAEWILRGRSPQRIIVECLEDAAPFRSVTNIPVVFVADLG
ncbi:4Fe-4S dicluster domain-containing protein [Nitrospirota bacterium]